ncbi:hypothetical protein QBC40DRAFT_307704 [Triangularia verruculosa]|uniref:Uncharacterized protein n=1 Tax=Triangularia verruculosa TaxID=2587418 RepID=A0AAN6XEP8_9PEZI|nr:hypothetical protein QBC40DRAFT_307704 [Triangularia verruculosa]
MQLPVALALLAGVVRSPVSLTSSAIPTGGAGSPTFTASLPVITPPKPTVCSAKPSCYTHTTTTTPRACLARVCPEPKDPIACPAYVKIVTKEVPCHNDCCPKTPTVTATATCPPCTTGCVIPTITETVTTGCLPTKTPTFPTIIGN